jgi:hypothetical protein
MRGRRGCDQDAIEVGTLEHRRVVGICGNSVKARGGSAAAFQERVRHSDDSCAGKSM